MDAALARRFAEWEPKGTFQSCCERKNDPEMILNIGVTQNLGFLTHAWQTYLAHNVQCPAMIAAFTQAFALCVRRCPAQLTPLVMELIDHAETLDADTALRLAHVVSDLGAKEAAFKLIAKATPKDNAVTTTTTAAAPVSPSDTEEGTTSPASSSVALSSRPPLQCAFYLSLLRLATESLSPPDMGLAIEVVERMERDGIPHSSLSIKQLLVGFSRMATPPVSCAIRTIEKYTRGKAQQTYEPCVLDSCFNVLDTAVLDDAKIAASFIRSLPEDVVHGMIKSICPEPPTMERAGVFVTARTNYYVIDPQTVDLTGPLNIPPATYVVFLYSSIRQIEVRRKHVCSVNPVNRQAQAIRHLLETNKEAVVVPYDMELMIRKGCPVNGEEDEATEQSAHCESMKQKMKPRTTQPSPAELELLRSTLVSPRTSQERLALFVALVSYCASDIATVTVVSSDQQIASRMAPLGIPVLRSLRVEGEDAAAGSMTPASLRARSNEP